MRTAIVILSLALGVSQAQAISTYNPLKMQCQALKDAVRNQGQIWLRWTSPTAGVPRYGRYVRDSFFCNAGDVARTSLIPSQDRKNCALKICRPFAFDEGGRW